MSVEWRRRSQVALGTTIVILAGSYLTGLSGIITGRMKSFDSLPLIKHADFIAYYTAAKLVVGGQGKELYDLSAQATTQIPLVGPGHGLLAFVNPPFLALILSPLGYLPYTVAYTAWIAIMLLAIVAGIWLLVAAAGFRGINAWLVGAVAITSVSVIVTLIQGQSTALVLLGLGLAYWAWRKEKMTLVGVALALTLFKPHLVLLIPGLLVVRKEWRALLAFMITAAVLVGVSALVLGGGVWLDYLRLVGPQAAGTAQHWASGTETQFGLIGILTTIGLSQAWGLVVCAIVGLGVLAKIATRPGQLALDFALVVVASFVIAPHANFHDTLVLLAAGVVVAGVLAHDKRASLFDKLVLAAMVMVGMMITILPGIVIAFVVLLWAVHLDYIRAILSPERPPAAVTV